MHSSVHLKQRGFTLIELLVTIAIIGILAAFMFPAFSRARENARRTTCQSNLKQIGIGLMQYSQDYDEKLIGVGNVLRWANRVEPYVKSMRVYDCPSFTGQGFSLDTSSSGAANNPMSYTINETYWQAGAGNKSPNATPPVSQANPMLTGGAYTISLSQIQSAATTLWVSDAMGSTADACFYWETDSNPTLIGAPKQLGLDSANGDVPVERHLDTCNVLFTDGHVKAMKLTSLMQRSATNPNVMKAFSIEDD